MPVQGRELIELLSIESVSVIGLLLVFCGYLIKQNNSQQKKHEKDREDWFQEIKDLREELIQAKDSAKAESDNFQEKYYTIVAKVLERINHFSDVLRDKGR